MPADPAPAFRRLGAATAVLAGLAAAAGAWAAAQTPAAAPAALLALASLGTALAALAAGARETGALRRQADRLRDALEALPDGLLVCDAEDRVAFYNARYPEHVMPAVARELALGRRFGEMLRAALARGPVYHPEMGAGLRRGPAGRCGAATAATTSSACTTAAGCASARAGRRTGGGCC